MPEPLIVPLTEPDPRRRLETCTRGFSDRFGDRLLTFDRGSATPLELLRFKPELSGSPAFEAGLRDRVDRTQVQSQAVAIARSVEHWDGALVLVSRHVAGRRLSEQLAESRGPAMALDFIRQMAPALAALAEANGRFGHGALTLDRVVCAHDGRLAIVEHPLGTAVESLAWPSARLNAELGLPVPPAAKPIGFDSRIDPIQLGFVALTLMLGRRLDAAEYPAGIPRLLDDSAEAKGGDTWGASRLRTWLERALQIGPRPFESANAALLALSELPTDADLRKPAPPPMVVVPPPVAVVPPPVVAVPPAPAPVPAPVPVPVAVAPPPAPRPVATPKPAAVPKPAPPLAAVPPLPPAPAAPVPAAFVVSEPPAPALAAVAKQKPRAPMFSWALVAVSAIALAEAVVIVGQWYFVPRSAASENVGAPPVAIAEPAPPPKASVASAPAPAPASPAPQVDAAPVSTAPRVGGVTFVSPLELQVFEGGKRIGVSGSPIALLEGAHTIEFVNESLGFRGRETVTVRPGEMGSRNIAVPNGRLSINALPWAEVWIDGTAAGQTPLANLSLAIGEHQITFRHPQFGEQRQTVAVKSEGVTRMSVTMQR